jgi:hypothetical protein
MRIPFFSLFGLLPILLPLAIGAQPSIRADKAYEDTVRVLILSNDSAKGDCNLTSGVGIKTRNFVLTSLTGIPNVKYLESQATTWADVKAAWPGKLPHVIVHVNAGWSTFSGNNLNQIMNTAADSAVGVVSIGDDAAAFAEKTFGFKNVNNQPQPMGDATQYRDSTTSLWIDLDGQADTVGGGGIIRNTTDSLHVQRLFFNPEEPYSGADSTKRYRCQEDADQYTVDPSYADKVTFMGFQRAFDGKDTVGGARTLQTIVSFQDDVRRGVALSYQPQFLANQQAAHQIDYDAILYASFAHFYRDPSLRFTDATGRALAPGETWSPSKGKLYLSFTDDYVRADLAKEIRLSIANGTGAADAEVIAVAAPVKASGGKGVWRAEITLVEKPAVASDGIAEVTLPVTITATVASHDENGLPDGGTATAVLKMSIVVVPPPPPPVDTILAAWMKDVDGNGAADQACFVFTHPLTALPASIGPVYWNDVSPKLANAKAPRLSFLAGSGQTVVMADFAGAEFPAGLTSVPPGAHPQATFPSDAVFGGQKPLLADSVGPVPLSAGIALGNFGVSAVRIPDTLTVTVSEPLRAGFPSLIRFGKLKDDRCQDAASVAYPVLLGSVSVSAGGLTYTLVLDPQAANPVSGDCAYLGPVLDVPGNAPSPVGVRITGPQVPQAIRGASGYPAVSGGGSSNPEVIYPGIQWIPPVGYVPGSPFQETNLPAPGQPASGRDATAQIPLTEGTTLLKVVSAGKYLARVSIFDNLGVFVKSFGQSFGYKGELENASRLEPLGYKSFLVWDGRDKGGHLAGQGVYIWIIDFTLADGSTHSKTVRTGLLR